MSDSWTQGYVSDVAYTLGHYRELAPSYLEMACLSSGVAFPSPRNGRPLQYCELGCGRGFGMTLLAAANPEVRFVGIDFNAEHIAEAQLLAAAAGVTNAAFHHLSFDDLLASKDPSLATFDVIAMHGVYSWVPTAVRDSIHQILARSLVQGGLAYVSYNTLPGWTQAMAVQKLLLEVATRTQGDSLAKVDRGMELLKILAGEPSGLVKRYGSIPSATVAELAGRNRQYLAHEFLSESWQPLFVTDAHRAMASAGLTFAGSANLLENHIGASVPPPLMQLVATAPDSGFRELLKDVLSNKAFRRDIFKKQPAILDRRDVEAAFRGLSFFKVVTVRELPERFNGPLGPIDMNRAFLSEAWTRFEPGYQTGEQLLNLGQNHGLDATQVRASLDLLVHGGLVHPGRRRSSSKNGETTVSDRLNQMICYSSERENKYGYLAAPVIGSAIPANLPERVLACVMSDTPNCDNHQIATEAFRRVEAGGHGFSRKGVRIEPTPDNVDALAQFTGVYRSEVQSLWRLLGVLPPAKP